MITINVIQQHDSTIIFPFQNKIQLSASNLYIGNGKWSKNIFKLLQFYTSFFPPQDSQENVMLY